MADIDVKSTIIQHQDMLEMQKNRIFIETASILSEIQQDLFVVISSGKTEKQQELEIKAIIDEAFKELEEEAKEELLDISEYEANFQKALVTEAVAYSNKGEILAISKELLETVIFKKPIQGSLLKESFRAMNANLQQQTVSAVRVGITQGLPVREIRNSVTAQLNTTASRYNSFIRTAVQAYTNEARDLTYNKNKKFIKGIQIVAIMDQRTTKICRGYNLDVYPVGEGPRPPFHYNCRTFTVPIFKDEDLVNENDTYGNYNPTEGGFKLSTDEKGDFKVTNKSITINQQKDIEEKTLNRKI